MNMLFRHVDPTTGEISLLPDLADTRDLMFVGEDIRFEEFLNLDEADQQRLADWLSAEIDTQRRRRRSADAHERFVPILGCVIANAIVAMEADTPSRVHYSRHRNEYAGATVYKPDWLRSKQFIGVVDALGSAGLLVTGNAPKAPPGEGQPRSTYRASPTLEAGLRERSFGMPSVVYDAASAPVVILRGIGRKPLNYDPTVLSDEITALRGYNDFLAEQTISLALPQGVEPARSPNLHSTRLRRIYNNDFQHGGRFYGHWCQGQPEEIRAHIRINDQPTIELDYSAFLPRALYNQRRLECAADPYAAPELVRAFEAAGTGWDAGRKIAKQVFYVMLNAKGLQGFSSSEPAKLLPDTITPKAAVQALRRHNEPIADRFLTGCSTALMKLESDVCGAVLAQGLKDKIPVLPIHDSFICREDKLEWLRASMTDAYRSQFGFDPVIT